MLDYQDYRYILQDTGTLFVGAKFTFGDIAKEEEIPFKFRSIVMRHLMTEVDNEDTFESVFYYMKPEGYLYEVFLQLRAKVKPHGRASACVSSSSMCCPLHPCRICCGCIRAPTATT